MAIPKNLDVCKRKEWSDQDWRHRDFRDLDWYWRRQNCREWVRLVEDGDRTFRLGELSEG